LIPAGINARFPDPSREGLLDIHQLPKRAFQRKRPLKPSGLEVHLRKIFVTEAHQRSLAGVQYGDGMARLDLEPAIKQDDIAGCREQGESWTSLMRPLALPKSYRSSQKNR
jgi:hypothetical protein